MLKLHYFYFLVVSTGQSICAGQHICFSFQCLLYQIIISERARIFADIIPMLIIADNNPCFHMTFPKSADFTFYQIRASQRGSRFFMLLIPISRVDVLWHSADVVGCITPATPRTINNVLKPTIVL